MSAILDTPARDKSCCTLETDNTGQARHREVNVPRHVPADTGPSYWGPGDRYTFLATGAQTDGDYFLFEAVVPPGGGPPPHIHHREQEAYYVLQGTLDVLLGDKEIKVSAGGFVHIPRGTVHRFHNGGHEDARMLIFFTPAGFEHFFEEVLEPVDDRSAPTPPITNMLIARMVAAGPKHGIEFV